MKAKNKITMYFHCAGMTSGEKCTILKSDDKTITIDTGSDEWTFDRKTGRCLNDNTSFGASRTIKPC